MKYKKKPVVIDAKLLEFTTTSQDEIIKWSNGKIKRGLEGGLIISTLEGDMVANTGDYIICGVQGEFYPCKPDIFKQSYEPIEDQCAADVSVLNSIERMAIFSNDDIDTLRDRLKQRSFHARALMGNDHDGYSSLMIKQNINYINKIISELICVKDIPLTTYESYLCSQNKNS